MYMYIIRELQAQVSASKAPPTESEVSADESVCISCDYHMTVGEWDHRI